MSKCEDLGNLKERAESDFFDYNNRQKSHVHDQVSVRITRVKTHRPRSEGRYGVVCSLESDTAPRRARVVSSAGIDQACR